MKAIIFLALLALSFCDKSDKRKTIAECAAELLGKKNRALEGAGLVRYCYSRINVQLSRIAHEQFNGGKAVTINQLKPGDIVGFNNHDGKPQPGHVGIVLTKRMYIHCPSGKAVTIGLFGDYKNFMGGRNYID